jgi:hypothetical protein
MRNPAFRMPAQHQSESKATVPPAKPTQFKKQKIPKALREQVWIHHNGKLFSCKCKIPWCQNQMTAFDFQCGHNIPESKGGKTTLENLIPICSRCNTSMGNSYTIDEWSNKFFAAGASVPVAEPAIGSRCCPWFSSRIFPSAR